MIYNDFHELKLSLLGFGTMRLPLIPGGKPADIDQAEVDRMVDCAIANGVNYFDTAFPYHESMSEIAIGKSLSRYPRDKFYLATKFPGHQIADSYNPAEVFEEQLKKCGVDYFDFYLLHNVNENSIGVYMDPKWGILDYFVEQKKLGRIKHLGFSCHGDTDCIKKFLDYCNGEMEFCQIQLNFLDWTLQNAQAKYELLTERGIPVWVMEPVRGGKLASLGEDDKVLKQMRPDESIPAWAFRFLQRLPNVKMVLSGMSNFEQMVDNVKTFNERKQLSVEESNTILAIAEKLKNAIPCTGCRYCCKGCPMELNIPLLISLYNDHNFAPSINIGIRLDSLGEDKQASNCIGCGQCAAICPQRIDIPKYMKEMDEVFSKLPKWADICKERAEAAKKAKG